jgi:hypothetical protein
MAHDAGAQQTANAAAKAARRINPALFLPVFI